MKSILKLHRTGIVCCTNSDAGVLGSVTGIGKGLDRQLVLYYWLISNRNA